MEADAEQEEGGLGAGERRDDGQPQLLGVGARAGRCEQPLAVAVHRLAEASANSALSVGLAMRAERRHGRLHKEARVLVGREEVRLIQLHRRAEQFLIGGMQFLAACRRHRYGRRGYGFSRSSRR